MVSWVEQNRLVFGGGLVFETESHETEASFELLTELRMTFNSNALASASQVWGLQEHTTTMLILGLLGIELKTSCVLDHPRLCLGRLTQCWARDHTL